MILRALFCARFPLTRTFTSLSLLLLGVPSCTSRQQKEESHTKAFGLDFNFVPKKEFVEEGRSSVAYFKRRSSEKRPLILFLHGLGNEPESLARIFALPRSFDKHNFVLLIPRGTLGQVQPGSEEQKIFWNATNECCGMDKPNDDEYLTKLVKRVTSDPDLKIDPAQVYIFGYSNGAFMAHTLACNHSEMYKGIIAYAGSSHADESLCQPQNPVNILHIHGTKDKIVKFDNPSVRPENPTAPWFPPPSDIVKRWAKRNQCSSQVTSSKMGIMDLNIQPDPSFGQDAGVEVGSKELFNSDKETEVEVFQDCKKGKVGFWKVNGGTHFNIFNLGTFDKAFEFVR